MVADRDRIDKLARDVADRKTVLWDEELGSTTDEEERDLVEQLQLVDRIVDAHWSLPDSLTRLDDFEIIGEIGRGGMGVVYEARQISLDRHVAIKVLSAEMTADPLRLRRFEQEAKALAALNHPNIVTMSIQRQSIHGSGRGIRELRSGGTQGRHGTFLQVHCRDARQPREGSEPP